MDSPAARIERLAAKYGLEIVYAFGSRAKEVRKIVEGKRRHVSRSTSDLDIGIKTKRRLSVKAKAEIGVFLEDLFGVARADVVVLPDAPIPLAFAAVTGELLYTADRRVESEYQLEIMRMYADLQPHLAMKRTLALESRP